MNINFFSLVVCTIGRTVDLDKLLRSLLNQTYKGFEVIIIDQNVDNRLISIVNRFSSELQIIYHKSLLKGLSANRNFGICLSKGNIICFPDDDCLYNNETLSRVNNYFNSLHIDIFCCSVQDFNTKQFFSMPHDKKYLTFYNFYRRCISIGIFVRYKEKSDLLFDSKLGAGAEYGSSEESDLIASLLKKHYIGWYNGSMHVYHPLSINSLSIVRYYNYGLGFGAFMRKQFIIRKSLYYFIFFVLDLTARGVFSIIPSSKRPYIFNSFKGRLLGFVKYRSN